MHPQPRVQTKKHTSFSHHRFTETIRRSLRDGFTAYSALSPVTGLSCHRRPRDAKHHRELDASVGASGPHAFAVRLQVRSSLAQQAAIASRYPTFVTIAKRPSFRGRDDRNH
jgi:hypothetical protein